MDKTSERVAVRLHWVGGVIQEQVLNRPVKCYAQMTTYPKLAAKLRDGFVDQLAAFTEPAANAAASPG